jgi:hypothetical protein
MATVTGMASKAISLLGLPTYVKEKTGKTGFLKFSEFRAVNFLTTLFRLINFYLILVACERIARLR